MLSSLSNNPGNGNQDGLGANVQSQEEPIIQEVYEPEPDDYNYQPQYREVDEEELRNLSAIRHETGTDTRVYMACALFLVTGLIGALIGYALSMSAADKADVARKTSMARTIKTTVETKLEGFRQLENAFEAVEAVKDTNYNENIFNDKIVSYGKYNFMLDISSEVTSEAILLAGDERANPLSGLRKYSASTMLLTQLLSNHVNETRVDSEEIVEIQEKAAKKVTYALQIIPDAIYYLNTDAPRNQYANGIVQIYTANNEPIRDDGEAARIYEDLKIDEKWSEAQRLRRDYNPDPQKPLPEDADILPNRLMYKVSDQRGRETTLFADEFVLVDRENLFGKSLNALERYKARTALIKKTMEEAKEASATLVDDLNKFIVE